MCKPWIFSSICIIQKTKKNLELKSELASTNFQPESQFFLSIKELFKTILYASS